MELKAGLSRELEITVEEKDLAHLYGNPGAFVLATPRICDLMETACVEAIKDHLIAENISVGTAISMKHLAATPLGMKVRICSFLKTVEGRKLTFQVEAFDEVERIAEGEHTRAVVSKSRFFDNVAKKAPQSKKI